jgi:hypothetical protein
VVAPRQFEMSDWIKESDRQEQQIGVAANPMRWREIVDVEFEILQAALVAIARLLSNDFFRAYAFATPDQPSICLT